MKTLFIFIIFSFILTTNLISKTKEITILVIDSLSQPIENAVISIEHSTFLFFSKKDTILRTDKNGIIKITLEDKKYYLTISNNSFDQFKTTLNPDESSNFVFTLNKCFEYFTLIGKIEFNSWAPLDLYFIRKQFRIISDCLSLSYSIDSNGTYKIINIPKGEYNFSFITDETGTLDYSGYKITTKNLNIYKNFILNIMMHRRINDRERFERNNFPPAYLNSVLDIIPYFMPGVFLK